MREEAAGDHDRGCDERDRDAVVGPAVDRDRVARADLALAHDPQVRARALGPREALEHLRIAEAQAQLEAREARLADLELDRAEPPALADHRAAHVDARDGEVLAEGAGPELAAQLGRPPRDVLARVRVDRLVRAAVHAPVGLVVALDIHAGHAHATVDGRLGDRALDDLSTLPADRLGTADVDGEEAGHGDIVAAAVCGVPRGCYGGTGVSRTAAARGGSPRCTR